MTLTIDKINQQLTKHVKENLKWDDLNTGSNTQNGEQSYIRDIIDIIHLMGEKIGSLAASQKPKDIQNVLFPSVSHPITYECKKSTTGKYILNDTIEEEQKSLFTKARECSCKMLNNNRNAESYRQLYDIMIHIQKNAVKMGDIELSDYGQMFKQASDFGIVKSRPRPNWSIKI